MKNFINLLIVESGVAIILGAIGYTISDYFNLSGDIKSIVVGVSVLTGSSIIVILRRWIDYLSDEVGVNFMYNQTGITKTFDNLEACEADMRKDFKDAKNIRLLLQIGRREFGNQEPSLFWTLSKNKNDPDSMIKVLKASTNSPFLSEQRARKRNYGANQWRVDMRRLDEALDLLKNDYNSKIDVRDHCEPYLWRIFLFDNTAYVSAYLYQRDNDNHAVVYKIKKDNNNKSLYTVFDKYFDYLWLKYDTSIDDPIKKFADWT